MDNNGLNNTFYFIIQYNGNWTFVTAECILTHHVITICWCDNQIDDKNDLMFRNVSNDCMAFKTKMKIIIGTNSHSVYDKCIYFFHADLTWLESNTHITLSPDPTFEQEQVE